MWLSNFRVVLADRVLPQGSVRVEGDRIAEIDTAPRRGADIDGGGLLLMPGFVDMHGDMIEREVEPRPGVRMPLELGLRDLDRRLIVGGVTTAYAAVSFQPSSAYGHVRSFDHSMAMLRELAAMRGGLACDHRVHARFEVTFPDALSVVEELIADGIVDLVSLTDHTPGQGQYRDLERYAAYLARNRGISAEEAEVVMRDRIAEYSRGAENLTATLKRVSDLCAAKGLPLASHDDDTPEKVALMAGLGAVISEFPVSLDAARAARDAGLLTAMGAPNALRGQSYSGNLSARDAWEAGVLDMLAADYHPSAMLPAVLALGEGDLPAAVRLVTRNPARALGLSDRGEIAPGLAADLVVADDRGVGHVRATLRGGRPVFSDGSLPLGAPAERVPA